MLQTFVPRGASATGFILSTKEFDENFMRLALRVIPDEAAKGLFRGGAELLRDSIKGIGPGWKAPHRKGGLWRSQRVEKPIQRPESITVMAGFNMVYAAYVHEGRREDGSRPILNWTEPGSGPFFLVSRLRDGGAKYRNITGTEIQKALRKSRGEVL